MVFLSRSEGFSVQGRIKSSAQRAKSLKSTKPLLLMSALIAQRCGGIAAVGVPAYAPMLIL